jgi:hypothetical protein
MDFLESKKISAFAKWSEVRETLVEHSAFQVQSIVNAINAAKKMSNDEERQAVFAEYIARKKEDMSSSDEEGRIRSPGSPGDDKKQKKVQHEKILFTHTFKEKT